MDEWMERVIKARWHRIMDENRDGRINQGIWV